MERCYPNSTPGCQLRGVVRCFGNKPFIYPETHELVPGPATLKRMEKRGWLVVTRRVKVGRYWYNERQVVPAMKEWADEYERKLQLKEQEQPEEKNKEEPPTGDDR